MNTIGEMKDIYVIARHVGISGERIECFLKTAEIAGYVLVRKECCSGEAYCGDPSCPAKPSSSGDIHGRS